MRYAKFETKFGSPSNARQVFERAIEYFGEDNLQENILLAFARFEEQQKEVLTASYAILYLCTITVRESTCYLPLRAREFAEG